MKAANRQNRQKNLEKHERSRVIGRVNTKSRLKTVLRKKLREIQADRSVQLVGDKTGVRSRVSLHCLVSCGESGRC